MKNTILANLVFLIIMSAPIYAHSRPFDTDSIPREGRLITLSTGGFVFFEWGGNEYVLADTRSGRVWKLIGKVANPDHFESIKYESSKGALVDQPENEATNQFPGRFAFRELENKYFVLDTVTGSLWILQGTIEKPIKLTRVPRKD